MLPKIIYDRLWNRKNYFKVLALLPNERRKSRIGKIKAMLDLAATEKCFVCISFEFSTLEISHLKLKKCGSNFKIFFPYPIIYRPYLNQI